MDDRPAHKKRPTHAWLRRALLVLGAAATPAAYAQPSESSRAAFQACDAQAFVALSIARNYMMGGRNKELVEPYIKDSAAGRAMAEEVYRRVDAGEVRHPGELAADALFACASAQKINVGAPRQRVALCYTRTDIAFFLHFERSEHVVRQTAVSKVLARLTSRELYPVAVVNQVANAVYAPPEAPDLQQLMRAVAWTCIRPPAGAASAASR